MIRYSACAMISALRRLCYIFYYEYANGKRAPFAHAPATFPNSPWPEFRPAKLTGGDTEAILKEKLGLSQEEIDALMADRIVVGPTITVK